MSYAYTLTAVTLREPVGLRENTKEDSAMEARRAITIVEIVAETLLTLAYTLCIVGGEAVRTRRRCRSLAPAKIPARRRHRYCIPKKGKQLLRLLLN